MKKRNRLAVFETAGVAVIFLIAAALYESDSLFGGTLAVLFGAANDSVWEHIKVIAAGYIAYALFEALWFSSGFKRFFTAKVFSLYALSLSAAAAFYLPVYFGVTLKLWEKAVAALILIALFQRMSYRLILSDFDLVFFFHTAAMLLMLYFLMFFSFTIFPPRFILFKDPNSGMYGVIESYIDAGAIYLDRMML